MTSKLRGGTAWTVAEENDIVARAREGDAAAFEAIIVTFRDRLFGLALGILKNRAIAEDVVQDALIKAFKALPGFRGESRLYTWLYRITVNTAHNYIRAGAKGGDVDLEEVAPVIESDDPDPAEITSNRELGEAIQEAIAKLPTRQREVFLLHYFEQLTHREIADALGITEGAVKANFFHAIQKLKVSLASYAT